MKEKLDFVRLPLALIAIFFVGNLILGATGTSYDIAKRLFSMVILQTHIALLWAPVGRRYRGYSIGAAIASIVLVIFVSQILIWGATIFSYLAGIHTYFNDPVAITGGSAEEVSFGAAMVARAAGLVANCILGVILSAIGWAMGGLIPVTKET